LAHCRDPIFLSSFTPGLFKAGAFKHPGLFIFAPCRDLMKTVPYKSEEPAND
jgi:hypothetical protein